MAREATIATIDIGTHTVLLLIAAISEQGEFRVLHDEQQFARLGTQVDAHRMLRKDAMERTAMYLQRYKETAARFGAKKIIAVGTSALRDAGNSAEFCSYIAATVGMQVEILSGDDEARWTFHGGIGNFTHAASSFSVLDIGGGSTEVIVGTPKAIDAKQSFDVGCVRVTERFLRSSPPTSLELLQARDFIHDMLKPVVAYNVGSTFAVAVAGTVTTMAALHLQLEAFDPEKINGFVLDRTIVAGIFTFLHGKTVSEIRDVPQIEHERADIILAGIMIADAYMDIAGITRLIVSVRGLRYGIVYREIESLRQAVHPTHGA